MFESKNTPIGSSDSPQHHEPDTVATPEGDNEFPPDAPLKPTPDDSLHTPAGLAPSPYDADKQPEEKPSGVIKFIDEVSRGEFM